MKLYQEMAAWWPLYSPPEEYREEGELFRRILAEVSAPAPRTVLELGSGAGGNAFYLKAHFAMTLVEPAPGMLALSRALNPECEHLAGDMRALRLGREFDAVFVHDAIMYMTGEDDLRRALETAFVHCRAGGTLVLAPDFVRETFRPSVEHGGRDGGERGLRYLEWIFDPDISDTSVEAHFAFLLREGDRVRVEHDRHTFGLFARAEWLRLLQHAGFQARVMHDEFDRDLFVARKPGG